MELDEERKAYLLKMRSLFCPKEMLKEDLTLDEGYFKPAKPKKVLTIEEEKMIIYGLEKYGFGEWKSIVDEFFPEADENEIRIKSMEIVGKQDLSAYLGKKMTAQELEDERTKNITEGKEKGLLIWGKVMASETYGRLV